MTVAQGSIMTAAVVFCGKSAKGASAFYDSSQHEKAADPAGRRPMESISRAMRPRVPYGKVVVTVVPFR